MKLKNIYFLVQDTNRAIEFYIKVLGMTLHRQQDRYTILKFDDMWVGLLNEKFSDTEVVRGNNCIPVFEVEDLNQEYVRLKDLNVKFLTEITILSDVRFFQFYDSEGNILEFYQEL
jgi:predicted enzyme related to lactoylglutathione lyase